MILYQAHISNHRTLTSYTMLGRAALDPYYDAVKIVAASLVKPLKFKTISGHQVSLLYRHTVPYALCSSMQLAAGKQFGCRECMHRVPKLFSLSDEKGPVFFSADQHDATAKFEDLVKTHTTFRELASQVDKCPIEGFEIVKTRSLFNFSAQTDGYGHWQVNVADADVSTVVDLSIIESALHRYVPELMPNLVHKLVGQTDEKYAKEDVGAAIESLDLMEKCLQKVAYGNTFLPALRWLRSIALDIKDTGLRALTSKQKWALYAKHLLLSPIKSDLQGAVCPFYHTANHNVVDLLCKAKDEDAMIALIKDRVDPQNYQRRDTTASITDNEVEIGIRYLGDFVNTIMTHAEAAELPHAFVVGKGRADCDREMSKDQKDVGENKVGQVSKLEEKDIVGAKGIDGAKEKINTVVPGGSVEALKNLIAARKKPVASQFAARNAAAHAGASGINTVSELLAYLEEHPQTKVSIKTTGMSCAYLAKTTLREDARAFPHFWAFFKSWTPSNYGLGEWADVVSIVPMYKYIKGGQSAMFVVDGVKLKQAIVGNCCFPSFLSSSFTRVCGKTFERLNTLTNVLVPVGESAAFALGTSAKDESGTVLTPVTLSLSDARTTVITIVKLE